MDKLRQAIFLCPHPSFCSLVFTVLKVILLFRVTLIFHSPLLGVSLGERSVLNVFTNNNTPNRLPQIFDFYANFVLMHMVVFFIILFCCDLKTFLLSDFLISSIRSPQQK